jgi:hypothetical protein
MCTYCKQNHTHTHTDEGVHMCVLLCVGGGMMEDLRFSLPYYEEFRLLGYEIRVRTSQETHHFSATVPSRIMLCEI